MSTPLSFSHCILSSKSVRWQVLRLAVALSSAITTCQSHTQPPGELQSLFLLVFLFLSLISPPPNGSATDSCQFHVESMDSCRLHIRNFLGAQNLKTWVEYAGWVQYGAVRCLHGSLNDFLCSCIFIRLRWLL